MKKSVSGILANFGCSFHAKTLHTPKNGYALAGRTFFEPTRSF